VYEFLFLTQEKVNEENKDSNPIRHRWICDESELIRKRPKSEFGLTKDENTVIDLECNYIVSFVNSIGGNLKNSRKR